MKRLLLVLLLVTGCTADASEEERITVFAAASLSRAFTAQAEAYERVHAGTDVVLSFAGSQSLVAQIQQGAPADVLATADVATIRAVEAELTGEPRVFAHNQLAIVTGPGNPKRLTSLADLGRKGVRLALAAPTVPVGKAAARALDAAGVEVSPVSLEDAVTGVVGKVRLGEADAGIAYVTDVVGADLAGTALPGTTTDLAIGALTAAGDPFLAFVLSPDGQAIMKRHGFR